MSYELYGCRRSGSLIIELALAEIGVPYSVHEIDLETRAQRDASYAAVNPQRKVPALVTPEGETLTESAAIVLTLDERHPSAGLLPAPGDRPRAEALRVLMFVATEIYPIVEINDYPERFAVHDAQAPGVRDRAREIWRKRWRLVEEAISGNPFLQPDGVTVVDFYIAVVSRWAQQDVWRKAYLPKVERLTAAVAARPVAAPIWQRHRPQETPTRFTEAW
ncbi:MAG: glutathione S-transferase family protein [Pseudomonadota bacterium]